MNRFWGSFQEIVTMAQGTILMFSNRIGTGRAAGAAIKLGVREYLFAPQLFAVELNSGFEVRFNLVLAYNYYDFMSTLLSIQNNQFSSDF